MITWHARVVAHSGPSGAEEEIDTKPVDRGWHLRPTWSAVMQALDHEKIKSHLEGQELHFAVKRRFCITTSKQRHIHTWGTREFKFTARGIKRVQHPFDRQW